MNLRMPSPKQCRSIADATARMNIWHGSVRSGKTIASLLRWVDAVADHDGHGQLAMIGKTERTLRRNILETLTEILGPAHVRTNIGMGESMILGRKVLLIGANDERSEQKIRGLTLAKAYGDEVTLWPESFFRMLMTRLSVPGAQFFGTTNPDSPRHYIKRDYINREAELDLRAFHFELADNETLDPAYVEAISKEFTGLWYKRFVKGLWVMAEGVIWEAFDEEKHVCDEVPDDVTIERYFAAVDYGTTNPFVAGLFGVGTDGRYYVLDEWRWNSAQMGRQLTDSQYSIKLGDWIQSLEQSPAAWYVDPSAASFILQLRQDHNWNVMPAINEVDDGLRLVGTLAAQDKLRISSRCAAGLTEVASYCWDPRAQEKGKDLPLKQDDHFPDMLRYGVMSDKHYDIGDLDQYGWVA